MFNIKQIPNEIILLHLYPIANAKGYNLRDCFPYLYNDFYEMLSKISSTRFKENLLVERNEINRIFQAEKRNLSHKWNCGSITTEQLNKQAKELNEEYEKKVKKLDDLEEIRAELFSQLEKVDLSKFRRGEPTFERIYHALLVATPGYLVKVDTESSGLIKIGTGIGDYISKYNEPTVLYSSGNKEMVDKCLRRPKVKQTPEKDK